MNGCGRRGLAALDFAGKPLLKLPERIEKVDLRGTKNLPRQTDLRACSRLKEVNAEGIAGETEFLLSDESQALVRRQWKEYTPGYAAASVLGGISLRPGGTEVLGTVGT